MIVSIQVKWLPAMKKEEDETVEEFALRVSKEVSEEWGSIMTLIFKTDAIYLIRSLLQLSLFFSAGSS